LRLGIAGAQVPDQGHAAPVRQFQINHREIDLESAQDLAYLRERACLRDHCKIGLLGQSQREQFTEGEVVVDQ
jgi:hypothetical protein